MNKNTIEKLKKIVKENYETIAEHYSETRKKVLWGGLMKICQDVAKNSKILDVGCGSGKLLQAFQDTQIAYLGIDPSNELLKKARENFPGYDFKQGDIMDLQAFNNNNDYVFCIAVLQHIPARENRILALSELKKKVCTNGRIIVSVWDMRKNPRFKKILRKNNLLKFLGINKMEFGDLLFYWKNSQGEIISERYYHAYRLKELEKDCQSAGLEVLEIYKEDNNIYAILKL